MIIQIGTIVSVVELTFDSLNPILNSGSMKFKSHLILAASIVMLAACTENKKAENSAVGTTPANFSAPSAQQQPATTTAGLNPAHGQPGHRCDIPVGAALSTPVQSNGSTPAVLPQPAATPLPTSNTVTPGTNPPHGQPGHDCSIAVGAPLNK